MGMYNIIWVPCPKCGELSQFQTKGGSCCLFEYKLEEAPDADVFDVNRHAPETCENCGQTDIWVAYDILGNRAENRRVVIGEPEISIISAKLDVCPDCGAEFQVNLREITFGKFTFKIEFEYCYGCGFIKNTTATKQKGKNVYRI